MTSYKLSVKKIWFNYILVHKWALLVIIGNFIIIITSLLGPIFLGKLIDSGLVGNNLNRFFDFLLYLCICYIFGKISSYFVNIGLVKLHYKTAFAINVDIVKHVQNLPIGFFYNKDIVYLSSRINDDSQNIVNFILENIIEIIVNIILSIAIIVIIFREMPLVSYILIICLCLYVFVYYFLNSRLYSQAFKQKENQNLFFSKLNELLANIKFIKSNCIGDLLINNIKNEFEKLLSVVVKYTKIAWWFSFSCDIIKYSFIIFYIYYFGTRFVDKRLTVGLFIIILNYLIMFFDNVNTVLNSLKEWKNTEVSFARCNELLSLDVETNGTISLNSIDSIEIKNLTYGYDSRLLYKNFNYLFSKNHIYCLVGENGKGKTTLISILMGILKPVKGEILFNKINIEEIDMKKIRMKNIAYSDQEPVLLNATIKDNLFLNNKLGKEIPTHYNNYLNLEVLNKDFVKGLEYVYDNETSSLSGGEKQKISQIRCFLKNSDVLIFDEPTAALDAESKLYFYDLLKHEKYDKIILLISHDNDLIKMADDIIKL